MDKSQNPYGFVVDFVYQTVAFVRHKFAGASYLPVLAEQGKAMQFCRGIAEKLVYPYGGPCK